MRKDHRAVIFGLIALVVILAAGASLSLAHSDNTSECGTCHATQGNVTLMSNATGTVDATVGQPFVLEISSTDPDLSESNDLAVKMVSAADNDQFSYSITLVEDDDTGDTNANVGEIDFAVTITPLTAGSWTIRIWAASLSFHGLSIDVTVDVAGSTTTTTTGTTTTTTQTTTTTTTTTTQTGLSNEQLVRIWEMMMMTFIPAAGILLVVIGVFVIRRANAQ